MHSVNVAEKQRDTGIIDRRPGSRRLHSPCTAEKAELVDDLVLSQEDQTFIYLFITIN